MLQKQLHDIIFQKQVFSGGSNPNSGEQQPPNENNEDHYVPPVNPNMQNAIQRAQLLQNLRAELASLRFQARSQPTNNQIQNRIRQIEQQIQNLQQGNPQI